MITCHLFIHNIQKYAQKRSHGLLTDSLKVLFFIKKH